MMTVRRPKAPNGPLGDSTRVLLHTAVIPQNDLTEIIPTDEGYDHIEGINRLNPAERFPHFLRTAR